jgi:spore germination protein YaaH
MVILVLAIIFLPPISLAERIFSLGYANISSEEGGFVNAGDGAQLMVLPEGIQGKTKIKFSPIPRSSFLEGSAGRDLVKAAQDIPPWLVMESAYYQIQFRGRKPPTEVIIRIPMPANAEPLHTLDLYAWDGAAWRWLPHFIPPAGDFIEAPLDYLPGSVVVMQTKPLQPSVSVDLPAEAGLPAQAQGTLTEINPQGLYLDAGGMIGGNPDMLIQPEQVPGFLVMPTLRNWEDGSPPRSDLVDNMLADAALREEHAQRVARLISRQGYPGVDVDYRGISPDLQGEYTAFITALAAALHAEGRQLSVRVELPMQVAADRWETGGYDWRAIGAVADTVKMAVPIDPNAYVPGGQMDTTLQWAVGEVNRHKLQLLVSTRSIKQTNGELKAVPYVEVLAPFGAVAVEGGSTSVESGQQAAFTLAGPQQSTGIQFDPGSGVYWTAYVGGDGQQHTIWVENGASVARKVGYVSGYNLRGMAVQNLLGEENDGQIWEVMRQLVNLVVPAVEDRVAVVWQVTSASGDVLAQASGDLANPRFVWTAPGEGGEYFIWMAISSDGGATAAARGSLPVLVVPPASGGPG